MSRFGWTLAFGIMLVVGIGWVWMGRITSGAAATGALPPAPAVGYPAPDFTLTTVTGESFTLSDLRGKPVLLNFWATWCPPCRAEVPELQAAHEHYAGELVIVGVDQAEPAGSVQTFVAQFGLTYPVPLDDQAAASRQYAVRSLPTMFFIDRDGIIRRIQSGPVTEATLAQALQTIYP